jgi:hypothetical protein
MLRQMAPLDRAQFLKLGAVSVAGLAGTGLAAPGAMAALQKALPAGDDIGFVQFGVLAERVALTFYREALKAKGIFDARERSRFTQARHAKFDHVKRLTGVLGEDAPSASDYDVTLPKSAFKTRASAIKLGTGLEELLVGVYLNGVAYSGDSGTRLLLGRLLTSSGQQYAAMRALAGKVNGKGLPAPIDLEQAGTRLDSLLKVNGYPDV